MRWINDREEVDSPAEPKDTPISSTAGSIREVQNAGCVIRLNHGILNELSRVQLKPISKLAGRTVDNFPALEVTDNRAQISQA